jgi:tetratricopeptide (TPR) repeat protein
MSASGPDARVRSTIDEVLTLLQRGQAAQALELVENACRATPGNLDLMLHRGLALRVMGRLPEALRALDEALAADPYFFLALMSKAAVLERMARPRQAARVYSGRAATARSGAGSRATGGAGRCSGARGPPAPVDRCNARGSYR